MQALTKTGILLWEAVLRSYSMIFFSLNRVYGLLILGLTFLDPLMGAGGLISVLTANGLALHLGLDENMIRRGEFGFNALLVGLGLGAYFHFDLALALTLVLSALLTLFLSVILLGLFSRTGLPFLSLPFVLALWTVMLAGRHFEALGLSQRGLYVLNELYAVGENVLVEMYHRLNTWALPLWLKTYFRSLGAILFQYNIVSGILLSLGLLLHSRISWFYSLLGLGTAMAFYHLIGADLDQLNYNYIGFNFILSAIAIGGIYLVPSRTSFIWVLLLIPLLTMLTSALAEVVSTFQLPLYALPFNLVVIGFLFVMKWRTRQQDPELVTVQTYVPEQHKYNQLSSTQRFRYLPPLAIGLPVMGEWYISQGHDGALTHRGEWRHAWDFIVVNREGTAFRKQGLQREDYYCYGKPAIAPADGTVVEVIDHVPDNAVGETNLEQNWGNSIVIQHGLGLYSQLGHLQPGSFKVKTGDYVRKGQQLARCGNSGRSPEPHLHFQLQTSPHTGAPTLDYPLALFLSGENNTVPGFFFFDYPRMGQRVQNAEPLEQMRRAFAFVPGRTLRFRTEQEQIVEWDCQTDVYGHSLIRCRKTGARAYLGNNGVVHYFTAYQGRKDTLLYHFFLAHYQVVLGFQKGLCINDAIPQHLVRRGALGWLQDLLAPFLQLMQVKYQLQYADHKGSPDAEEIRLESAVDLASGYRRRRCYTYRTVIRNACFAVFEVRGPKKNQVLTCEELP